MLILLGKGSVTVGGMSVWPLDSSDIVYAHAHDDAS